MVTSGAIARGHAADGAGPAPERDRRAAGGLGGRPGLAVPRLRGAARRAREVHAAQVLLTSFDMSARMHYLNARQTLRRLLDWHVVPVINENDTTATDEITFGDNDFLSAQVAILLEARAAGPAHRHRRACTPPTRAHDPEAELIEEVDDFARARGATRSATAPRAFGSGGMRSKVAAAEMASAAGIPVVICDGTADGHAARGRAGRAGRDAVRGAPGADARASSCGCATRSRPAAGWWSTRARRGCCASAARPCCRSGSPGSRASFAAGDAVEVVVRDGESSARGSPTTRPPSSAGSRA